MFTGFSSAIDHWSHHGRTVPPRQGHRPRPPPRVRVPSGEIYGGSRSAWDYGPLGTELKENIRRQWWQTFVRGRGDMVGLDSSIILPKRVWEASGHVATFTDPLVECLQCHKRFRADNLIEDFEARKGRKAENGLADIPCPNCGTKGQYTEPKASPVW